MDHFEHFVLERKRDLARIARHSRGEHAYDDVVSEAWLMAITLSEERGVTADFTYATFQTLLLSHLYQHLVRYTELTVRHAVRLDHPARGSSDGDEGPSLLERLADNNSTDPLAHLIIEEAERFRTLPAEACHSLASAYVLLLEHFRSSIYGVARYLLISTSQAYRRFAKARTLTTHQHALVLPPPASFALLKPWRTERAVRVPRQLEFDFTDYLFVDEGTHLSVIATRWGPIGGKDVGASAAPGDVML